MRSEPFALAIYRRYLAGETAEELAASEGIPLERIKNRLKAAAAFLEKQKSKTALGAAL